MSGDRAGRLGWRLPSKPEKAQDGENDDDEADEIDNAVHGTSSYGGLIISMR